MAAAATTLSAWVGARSQAAQASLAREQRDWLEQARAQLLDERLVDPQTQRPFELWLIDGQAVVEVAQQGSASTGLAWLSGPLPFVKGAVSVQPTAKAPMAVLLEATRLARRRETTDPHGGI